MIATGFISEMNALPVHGGGITLARILGQDLERFDWFAETIRYTQKNAASYGDARSHSYPFWPFEKKLRPLFGCRASYWLASHPRTRRSFAKSVARKLLRDEPGLPGSRMLVCPQGLVTPLVLEELRKPIPFSYVTWIMDDHVIRWGKRGWEYPRGFEEVMHRHLTDAEQVFVISPNMQDFYQSRFGVESTVLCGPAPLPQTCRAEDHVAITASKKPRLAYFGSLGRWQNDAIEWLAPLLVLGAAQLDVYSHNPESLSQSLADAGAIVRQGIPATEVLAKAACYDAVVLPISFKPELRNMSYFNIATKFSECLASAAPTLLIGPEDSAMVAMARKAGACLIVDQPAEDAVRYQLEKLNDAGLRRSCVAAEHQLLEAEFTPAIMKHRWASARRFLWGDA